MPETVNIWSGKLVRLRSPEPSDAEAFHADIDDSEGQRSGYEITFPRSLERSRKFASDEAMSDGPAPMEYRFAIESLEEGTLVGTINTNGVDQRNGHFAYGISIFHDYRKRGYASDAILLVLRYYFQELRFQKVNATVYGFNRPSLALHRRLGFVEEGCLRQNLFTDGRFHDEYLFGMTAQEFRARYGD